MRSVIVLDSVDSTNSIALSIGRKGGASGTVVIAREQRKGRGRMGRGWFSPKGKGLYMSILLRPEIEAGELPKISLIAALSMASSLEKLGVSASIRWPNDIMARGRKIGGVLIEAEDGFVVVGFGVNTGLKAKDMPPEIKERATSIVEEIGIEPNAFLLAESIIDGFERLYRDFVEDVHGWDRILSRIKGVMDVLGHRVEVTTGTERIEGVADSLGPSGELVIVQDDGRKFMISSAEGLRIDSETSSMPYKLMAIAVGNSMTRFGFFSNSGLMERYVVRSGEAEHELLRIGIDPGTNVVVGSVVPLLTERLVSALIDRGFEPRVVTGRICVESGIDIAYDDPDVMGIDRVASSIAASVYYGSPVIVVDFGTAISITAAVDKRILGGPIIPGPSLWLDSLSSGTALLPSIPLPSGEVKGAMGRNTVECMESGLFFGITGAVREAITGILEEVGRGARVVATGGYSGLFAPRIREIDLVDPDLGLKGLAVLFDMIWGRR
jgi:BirA family biotin operon repressor/biotin-[acetyl-CoA-carboxylase] ligase